jgi:outer membrane protein assembly factor BamB
MNRLYLTFVLALAAFPTFVADVRAQRAPIISETDARRHGFSRGWLTQIELDRLRDRVTSMELSLVSQPDPAGVNRDILFVQTNHGLLQALDAETGRTLWVQQVGDRDFLSLKATANDEFVCVTNGEKLYVQERLTGKPVWEKYLNRSPSQPVTLGVDVCHIPSFKGEMTSYPMPQKDPSGGGYLIPKEERVYKSFGSVDISPMITRNTAAWGTSRGFVFVGAADLTDVRFRFETGRGISAPLGYWPPFVLVASRDGYVYALNEFGGEAEWKFAAGHPISQQPVAIDGQVYLISEIGGMYCVSAAVGKELWFAPGVRQFVAASKDRVYATDDLGRLLVLDARSGGRLERIDLSAFPMKMVNTQTDRIYLATPQGFIQCLHEVGLDKPLVHQLPDVQQAEPANSKPATDEDDEDADDEDADDVDADDEDADVEDADDEGMDDEGMDDDASDEEEDDPF